MIFEISSSIFNSILPQRILNLNLNLTNHLNASSADHHFVLSNFNPSSSFFANFFIGSLSLVWLVVLVHVLDQLLLPKNPTAPPLVFHFFPVIGSALAYGLDPYGFLESCRRKYGNVFTFVLLKKKMTVALGPAGNSLVLNGKLSEVNAEEAYTALTTPVFGTEVVYDCPNALLMQQKKFIKSGLSVDNFRKYVPMIVKETSNYLDDHVFLDPASGKVIKDVFMVSSEITILTAAATLQGREVREALNKSFARLYHDLDGGFTPLNFVFPNLPLPSYRRRDQAQTAMSQFYLNIIKKRRQENRMGDEGDMLDALQGQAYKDGSPLSDKAIAHIMIALLMAGQHTSAATGAWLLCHLADNPDIVADLRSEQVQVFGTPGQTDSEQELQPLDFDRLQTPLLNACIKETLRLHPPIHSIMRKVKSPITVPQTLASVNENTPYVIPTSHYVLAAPGVSQIDSTIWDSPHEFRPTRWFTKQGSSLTEDQGDMVDYGFGNISSGTNSPFLPFGAGRHRCIGEQFAYLQLASVVATIIRRCDLKLVSEKGMPKSDYTTMLVCPKKPRDVKFINRSIQQKS
ncbi:hypothetical protein O181_045830 [Austropuccinia psidii MF-1]|uniref:Uncharacterized protein n=1 Tax=Austropuccinia psidii MF-1 TaxID=1389203 RepID=A0A9Q3DME3_9BASI|nr:hypothetical protein [Austropuccinia psidii MF-1]